jgi:hypothetical protein
MVMLSPFDAETFVASVTRAVNEKVPAVVGVPERLPLALRDTPPGKLPDSRLHEYGGVPPAALTDAE